MIYFHRYSSAICMCLLISYSFQTLEYPVEWLRHNCQCEACFNPACLAFKFMMKEIVNLEMKLKSVSKTEVSIL
jgi:hypothetical protein